MTKMSIQVKAAVAEEVNKPLSVKELTLDDPRPNEVQVRMVATGVCHTDAVIRDGWIPTSFPLVLGHEGAGVVEKVGSGVTRVAPGDHVVLSINYCGNCSACLRGHPSYCRNQYALNFAGSRTDGSSAFSEADGSTVGSHFFGQSSFATLCNADVNSVVKVRQDVPLELLGPLGCGVQTGSGAVINVLRPEPGSSIVVFGSGAVGMSGVLAAVAQRVGTIIAVDVVDSRLETALSFGATHTINGKAEDVVARIQEITGGGVDYALDTTGVPQVFRQMIDSLGMGGHAGSIGAAAAGSEGIIDLPTALSRGIKVTWIVEGDATPQTFIPELIELWQKGDFPFDRMTKTYAFDDINEAFEASENGSVLKPIVVF